MDALTRARVLEELTRHLGGDRGLAMEVEYVLMHFHSAPAQARECASQRYRAYVHRILNLLRDPGVAERLRGQEDVPKLLVELLETPERNLDDASSLSRCEERLELIRGMGGEVALPNAGMRCARCDSTDIKFNMLQLRSADEPMSIFCSCRACGKRWRM